jgi:hypothetical protein
MAALKVPEVKNQREIMKVNKTGKKVGHKTLIGR